MALAQQVGWEGTKSPVPLTQECGAMQRGKSVPSNQRLEPKAWRAAMRFTTPRNRTPTTVVAASELATPRSGKQAIVGRTSKGSHQQSARAVGRSAEARRQPPAMHARTSTMPSIIGPKLQAPRGQRERLRRRRAFLRIQHPHVTCSHSGGRARSESRDARDPLYQESPSAGASVRGCWRALAHQACRQADCLHPPLSGALSTCRIWKRLLLEGSLPARNECLVEALDNVCLCEGAIGASGMVRDPIWKVHALATALVEDSSSN